MKVMSDIEAASWKGATVFLSILSLVLLVTLGFNHDNPEPTVMDLHQQEVVVTDTVTVHDTIEVIKVVKEPIVRLDTQPNLNNQENN